MGAAGRHLGHPDRRERRQGGAGPAVHRRPRGAGAPAARPEVRLHPGEQEGPGGGAEGSEAPGADPGRLRLRQHVLARVHEVPSTAPGLDRRLEPGLPEVAGRARPRGARTGG